MRSNKYVLLGGGLGDIVLSTPIYQALKSKFAEQEITVIYRTNSQEQVLRNNPYIDRFIRLSLYYKVLLRLGIIKPYTIEYAYLRPTYSYRDKKAQEIIAEMVDVKLEDSQLQIYISNEEDNEAKEILANYINPVIIHITSLTSKDQMWPAEYWRELVKNTSGYSFIQIGLANEDKIEGTVDLRGKTGIRLAMSLVKNSVSFIGVVSFLSHVTNAFNTPGVVLFGPSSIGVWGHLNNVNLSKDFTCSPCVDLLIHSPCPYGQPCMKSISVKEVVSALLSQTNNRIDQSVNQ